MNEFNISKRTALRDIEDLEAIGLSFYVENGRYGGYKLLKQKLLTPIYFDNSEIISIFFALKALKVLSNTPFEKSYSRIYEKLFNTLSESQKDYIKKLLSVVNYTNTPPVNDCPYLNLILDSIINENILKIEYTQYAFKEKIVQVLDLFYRNGIWFCNAFDISNNSWAVYRCDYIKNCSVYTNNKNSYSLKYLQDSLKFFEKKYKNINFKCKITNFGKEIFLKNHYPTMTLEEKNNGLYITGSFNKNELNYMVHYLIGFGNNIIIQNPKILKVAYLKELEKIIKQYE